MNPALRRRYPDDDEFGKVWLEEGRKIEQADEHRLSYPRSHGCNVYVDDDIVYFTSVNMH